MKINIFAKFIFVYILFGLSILFTVQILGDELITQTISALPAGSVVDGRGIMTNLYILASVIYLLSFVVLFSLISLILVPLRNISLAAKEYAMGNLDYEIDIRSSDELGYLSASLNYMASKLKDSLEYQNNFIGNISHDFRTPLTSIQGYSRAMIDGTIPIEEQDRYLKIIHEESQRLGLMTEDLLQLIALEQDQSCLNIVEFNLINLINNVCSTFESKCNNKNISIKLVSYSNSGQMCEQDIIGSLNTSRVVGDAIHVSGDTEKIKRVFYNLIDNAVKFTDVGGNITLEIKPLDSQFIICIKDSGCGIPEEYIGRVFQRFFKGDSSRGQNKEGTGLGLAIVEEILIQHGEKISVSSSLGDGTEFIFTLPRSVS